MRDALGVLAAAAQVLGLFILSDLRARVMRLEGIYIEPSKGRSHVRTN